MLAAFWAMLGLGNAYAVLAAQGATAPIVVAIVLNVVLIAAAALAFWQIRAWRLILLIALLAVTADRIYNALTAGGGTLTSVSALVALAAIAALTLMPSASRA
jgi:hypothetical protein